MTSWAPRDLTRKVLIIAMTRPRCNHSTPASILKHHVLWWLVWLHLPAPPFFPSVSKRSRPLPVPYWLLPPRNLRHSKNRIGKIRLGMTSLLALMKARALAIYRTWTDSISLVAGSTPTPPSQVHEKALNPSATLRRAWNTMEDGGVCPPSWLNAGILTRRSP